VTIEGTKPPSNDEHEAASPSAQPPRDVAARWSGSAGAVTAVLGAVGAFWYALMSLASAVVYAPLRVEPREVGLGSAEILGQAAIGLAVVVAAVVTVGAAQAWIIRVRGHDAVSALKALVRDPSSQDEGLERNLKRAAGGTIAITLLASLLFVWAVALSAREDLKAGVRPRNIALPSFVQLPWRGDPARVRWTEAHRPPLPPCLLYLGQSDGTAVFYDARRGHEQTWRIPAPEVLVNLAVKYKGCPLE
jgi:hypothetical protein